MRKNRTKVVWIGISVATIFPFCVDVPSSSQSVGFGTQTTWTEADDKIELGEIFRPACLSSGEDFGGGEVHEVFVICNNIYSESRALQVVSLYLESFENGEEFLIMDVVIEL